MELSNISWTDHTENFWRGCTKVSPGCQFCLDGNTPVMMLNGLWKPLKDVVVGDVLAGCTELGTDAPVQSANRTLQESTVTAAWETQQETIEITLASGRTVVCSPSHRWLVRISNSRTKWIHAEDLTLASRIVAFGNPDTAAVLSDRFLLGYLAGATAGDGTMRIDGSGKNGTKQSYWRIAVLESDMQILSRIGAALAILGIEYAIKPFPSEGKNLGTVDPKPMSKIEQRSQAALEKIAIALEPSEDRDWQAGWVSGFFDTDGSLSGTMRSNGIIARWSQVPARNDHLERLQEYLDNMGLAYTYEIRTKIDNVRLLLQSTDQRVQALSMFAPALPRKGVPRCVGSRIGLRTDQVVGVKRGPVKTLIDISTSTRTFIANGLITHNCYAESERDGRYGKGEWGPTGVRSQAAASYITKFDRMNKAPWVKCLDCGWRGKEVDAGKVCPNCKSERMDITYQRVFVMSLGDFFEKDHPSLDLPTLRRQALENMATNLNMNYLVLTKRIELVMPLLDLAFGPNSAADWLKANPHVMIGTSVENRDYTWRITELAKIPTSMRWVSFEPLLGSIDLASVPGIKAIDWGIIGGESGRFARPMNPASADRLEAHLDALRIATHFKQNGEWVALREIGQDLGDGCYLVKPEFHKAAHGARWGEFVPAGTGGTVFEEADTGWDADALGQQESGLPIMIRIGKRNDPCTLNGTQRREFPEALQ